MNEKCAKCSKELGHGIGLEIIFRPFGDPVSGEKFADASFKLCPRCAYIYRLASAKWLNSSQEEKK